MVVSLDATEIGGGLKDYFHGCLISEESTADLSTSYKITVLSCNLLVLKYSLEGFEMPSSNFSH